MIVNLDKHPSTSVAAKDSDGGIVTYGDIIGFSQEIAGRLPRRSLVFLLTRNNIGGIAWCIGLLNAGIVPLILNAHIEKGLLTNLLNLYKPQYVCLPDSQAADWKEEKAIGRYGYSALDTGGEACLLHHELSHLLPTSGSTGSPKLVRHKYDNIQAAALNISTFFELNASERPLLVLPLYYTMGLSIVFSHLWVGATLLITDLHMTDKAFWTFLKEERATSFTGVPYSFEILDSMRFFRMELPDLKLLTQGGGKMRRQLNLKFAEYCRTTGKRWIATYGQSEGTARMAYLPSRYALSKCGSIGYAVPNGELSLLDASGRRIDTPYTEGEMCYRGKNVTMGYAATREDLLRGDEWKGFLRTGDLAYYDADGCYYIVGRLGRFVKLYGLRIGLDECEQIIKAKYPIACACVGSDEKLTVYLEDENYVRLVKEELVDKTKLVASAFDVKVIDVLPKNEAGKILYSKLKVD